ncbi:uncharacterized protein N7479_004419 [Penicillium vulpinum]|uniref:uncharacterized protein n=1 Tax=Penicillium vulpinum TaxID=29845 RepID=UPI002549A945|nr:uncharacterized protein N7479_004419 [Penicillium vulpinum]KAJ5964543.1 hypothetical protein N7479_004419 [Penicillium vulpinum]
MDVEDARSVDSTPKLGRIGKCCQLIMMNEIMTILEKVDFHTLLTWKGLLGTSKATDRAALHEQLLSGLGLT